MKTNHLGVYLIMNFLLMLLLFFVVGLAEASDKPTKDSSFGEITSYFNMHDIEIKPDYKYDKRSMFKITSKERQVMSHRFGDDFYIVEFFVSIYANDLLKIRGAAEFALKLRESHDNIIVKTFIVAKTADSALSYTLKNMMENPELVFARSLSPVPDVLAFEARARGVNSLPSMVITKGYGEDSNVIVVKSGFQDKLSKILKLKMDGRIDE